MVGDIVSEKKSNKHDHFTITGNGVYVYHLREESSDSDSLAFIDVAQGWTQTIHNGRQLGTSMLSYCPTNITNMPNDT